jgi:hypothetical protein
MESGIYQLTFPDGARYVGKSINIPRRWKEHRDKFIKGTAAKNMQDRYNRYGFPDGKVLFECHGDHIDLLESYFICLVQPELNATPGIRIYEHELPIFEENPELLQLATTTHITMINELRSNLDTLQNKYAELKVYLDEAMLETRAGERIEELEMELQDHEIESEALIDRLQTDLEEADARAVRWEYIAKKPWWKKLLGIE